MPKTNLHCVESHEAESALFFGGASFEGHHGSTLPISDLEEYLPVLKKSYIGPLLRSSLFREIVAVVIIVLVVVIIIVVIIIVIIIILIVN